MPAVLSPCTMQAQQSVQPVSTFEPQRALQPLSVLSRASIQHQHEQQTYMTPGSLLRPAPSSIAT